MLPLKLLIMGKVYLNSDNKLVVETGNGVIRPDGTTYSEIKSNEEYTISADDVAVLLNIINRKTVVFESRIFNRLSLGHLVYKSINVLSGNDFEETLKNIAKIQEEISEENKMLKDAIFKYNEDKKIFWRPIEIDYGNTESSR